MNHCHIRHIPPTTGDITKHSSKIIQRNWQIHNRSAPLAWPHYLFGRPTPHVAIPRHLPCWPDTPVRIGFIGQSGADILAAAGASWLSKTMESFPLQSFKNPWEGRMNFHSSKPWLLIILNIWKSSNHQNSHGKAHLNPGVIQHRWRPCDNSPLRRKLHSMQKMHSNITSMVDHVTGRKKATIHNWLVAQ